MKLHSSKYSDFPDSLLTVMSKGHVKKWGLKTQEAIIICVVVVLMDFIIFILLRFCQNMYCLQPSTLQILSHIKNRRYEFKIVMWVAVITINN